MDDVIVLDTIVVTPGSNADIFRSDYGIDSLAQAQQAIDNADRLFAADGHLWDNDRDFFDETAREVKQRFEDGTYKEGELAESEPMEDGRDLWGNARHVANDSHEWKAICSVPDFCKVGNAVVPFDSFATLGNQTQSSPDVKAQDVPVYRVGDLHKGVQGDAGSHVVAGTSLGGGYVRFLSGQNNVKVNGIPLVRQDSTCLVNCNGAGIGGAPGKVVTTQRSADTQAEEPAQEANPELQALLDAEADERSLWQKTKDFGSGAWSSAQRIADASADDPLDTGIGVLKGIGNLPTDLWNLGVLASKYSSAAGLPSIAMRADAMEKAALAAHQAGDLAKANELASQASQMMASGYADDLFELTSDAQTGGSVLSMLIPVGAAAKGAGTLGKAARGTRALDAAADTARAADVAGDAAKAGRSAEVTQDATKANDIATEGVHIKRPRTVSKNGYTYHLDDQGRVTKVEGDLKLNKSQGRNAKAQREAGGADRLSDDQGGHYIGRRFDGPMDDFNHFAQNGNFNNSAYKKLENAWDRALQNQDTVKVEIVPKFKGDSLRPDTITVRHWINGEPQPIKRFRNQYGG
ncbi:DNA/RNA non-specific endonuclease [Phytopseudomonas daroniae]|nr:DNA/RNA non-specific endonuclease [Pseudomonas daroniae]